MKVAYRKAFLKQLAKIPSSKRASIEQFAFEDLPRAESIASTGKIEKMKGYDAYYNARFGAYRVGMTFDGETLVLAIVADRKEIYRFFP